MELGLSTEARLSVANPSPALLPGSQLLHDLVHGGICENHAIDYLDPSGKRHKISYLDLHSRSDLFAQSILLAMDRNDTTRDRIVPVLIPQSPDLYIVLLAILKAGCAFCPLNLDAPEERIRFILGDVSAKVIVTTSALRDCIPSVHDVKILIVDEDISQCSVKDPATSTTLRPSDPAYVMYTSGSTGKPKGVVVSHLAATQSLLAHERHIPKFSRFLQFAAPTFDVSVFEIFFPLFRGCTLVCCDRSRLLNDLPSVINETEADAAELTPTVASGLLQERRRVPGLKLLLTIGEMLTRSVIEEFGQSHSSPGILFGMYGPTEAAIHCTLEPTFQSDLKAGIIGRPLDTTSAMVVKPLSDDVHPNQEFEILPIGHVGELAVGGHQLADGYLNRPEQTLKAFNDTLQFGRIYRTGDKARMLPDGRLECLGRIATGQVKLRGQRIELGEIEHVILRLANCTLAAACVIDGTLVVFCVKRDDSLHREAVLQICRRWLPSFMIPSDVVLLDSFPQLPSGKVDKRQLEEDYRTQQNDIDDEDHGISDGVHDTLCHIFGTILQRKIQPSSELPTAGLDSLLAIKAASCLREAGWEVGAVDLLKAHNILQLAPLLQERKSSSMQLNHSSLDGASDYSVRLKHDSLILPNFADYESRIADVYRCTPLQLSMLAETAMDSKAYFNWIELEFPIHTPLEKIKRSFGDLVRKNDILRSGFCPLDDPDSPYALVVWERLDAEQIRDTDSLDEGKQDSALDILHPLRIDLSIKDHRPHALICIHHALYDGWSVDLILTDLATSIRGSDLVDRPQFYRVTEHYRNPRLASFARTAEEYWEERLLDYQPAFLPNFHGRKVNEEMLKSYTTILTPKLEAIRVRASASQIGPQVLCQAALAYLLSCYHNSNDITFGTVTSGRTLPITGIEDIIGPCLATLPLRLNIEQCQSTEDLLRLIHQSNRDLLEHDKLTLKDIKRIAGVKPGAKLFDTLFIWQETLQSDHDSDNTVRVVDSWDQLEFNLTLEFEPSGSDVFVHARYQSSILPEAQVLLLLQQLDAILNNLLHAGDADLNSLSKCFPDAVLSIELANTTHNVFDSGLANDVESGSRHYPTRPALAFYKRISDGMADVEQLSYSELNKRANQLAHYICSLGVRPNDLVCICMEKCPLFYVAVLAVVKSGAGYLPVTPQTPRERIQSMLDDAQPRLCLSLSSCFGVLPENSKDITIEVDLLELDTISSENIRIQYRGDDAAYAVFTSGSTGTPKGLLVTQDNLLSNLKELAAIYPTSAQARLLQSCSQAFDVSVFEIFFAWQQGMCLCSATNDILFRDIELSIAQMGITHLSLTPTVASLIDPTKVPRVQFLVTAGEGVTEQVFRRWADKGLYQGYGPAETVNICTVRPSVSSHDAINNIGNPLQNTSVFVLDPLSTDTKPKGGVGELCFGGDQVCRGYLNRSALTSEKFINHPKFGRLYRSGDLGRLLPDGAILFEGRADDQIKIRGQRVELGEINRCALAQSYVYDCVTVLTQSADGKSARLVAFWVPLESKAQTFDVVGIDQTTSQYIQDLYNIITSRLAHYMIPSNLIPVTIIPQTPQGKVDKRLLSSTFRSMHSNDLAATSQGSGDEPEGEWTSLERQIAATLSKVLQMSTSEIQRATSFFNLGLDSISAIPFSRALEASAGSSVLVSEILRNPTVARLSRALESGRDTETVQSAESVPFYSAEDVERLQKEAARQNRRVEQFLPCTPLQTAMLTSGLGADDGAYCNRVIFYLKENAPYVRECFIQALKRHQIFRTAFINDDSSSDPFVQAVLSDYDFECLEIEIMDDSHWASFLSDLQRNVRQSVETALPPLTIATVVRGERTFLVFFCHHALYDGIAFATLIEEVESLYKGIALPPPPQFEPFIRNIIKQHQSNDTQAFWKAAFEDLEPVKFPSFQVVDSSGYSNPENRHEITDSVIDMPLQELELKCRQLSCTVLSVLQAAWAKVLAMFLSTDDVCFGTVVSGRHTPVEDIDHLVAPCFNTIPIRADLSTGTTNHDLIKRLQQFNGEALSHSLSSLRQIQSSLELDGSPLFDSLILLQQSEYTLDRNIWTLEEDSGDMDFPLILEFTPARDNDTLRFQLHYDVSLLQYESAQLLLSVFKAALHCCIESSASKAFSISSISYTQLYHSTCDIQTAQSSPSVTHPQGYGTLPPIGVVLSHARGERPWNSGTTVNILFPEDDTIVPLGAVGEVVVQENEEAKPQNSKDDHHSSDQCRTGYLARMHPNGVIQLRGCTEKHTERISQTVRDLPFVQDATIVSINHSADGSEDLVAFIVLNGEADSKMFGAHKSAACDALKDAYSLSLSPQQVCLIDRLPYTKSGKLNMRRLRSLFRAAIEDEPLSKTPHWSTTEITIRNALQEVSTVSLENIHKNTTIFRLGLDSISATKVAMLLRKSWPSITVADILQHPTCGSLAQFIDQRLSRDSHDDPHAVKIDFSAFEERIKHKISKGSQKSVGQILPCTPTQNGILSEFLKSFDGLYCNRITLKLHSTWSFHDIRTAMCRVTRARQMLRTGFVQTDEPQHPFAMLWYDSSYPAGEMLESNVRNLEQWRNNAAAEIQNSLQRPPWRMLHYEVENDLYIDLVILHALYDAHSLQMIFNDLAQALQDQIVQEESDIAVVLREIIQSSSVESKDQRSFWTKQANSLRIVRFPDMNPLQQHYGSFQSLSRKCSQSCKEVEQACSSADVTVQAVAQASWARLLAAYLGEDQITFGIVLSGRESTEAESACFPCITTLPYSSSASPGNESVLKQAMDYNNSVRKFQFAPLASIRRWSGHTREALFDTIFAYQRTTVTLPDLPWTVAEEYSPTDYAVSVELEKSGSGYFSFRLTFDTTKLPQQQAETLLHQLDMIFVDLVLHPNASSEQLYKRHTDLFSITPAKHLELPSNVKLLHEFVEEKARQIPDRYALEFVDGFDGDQPISRYWTYSELNDEGNRVRSLLCKQGVEAGQLIAICFDKCPEASFAILGVLKTGYAYVAIDPNAPTARKQFILDDSKASLVLSSGEQAESLKTLSRVHVFDLANMSNLPSAAKNKHQPPITPSATCYCLYTSGTTGTPKGCEITHENAVQAMLSFQHLFSGHWDKKSRWLQFASFHFDVSVLEQYWSWSVGIRVVSAPRDLIFEDLASSIRRLKITHIDLTPSLAKLLTPDDVPDLCRGVFITGGEKLQQEILDVWGPKGVIYNGYGPTEATIGVTMYPRVPANGKPSNIGPQFLNVGSYVLKPGSDIPVLRGAVGELCVSGKLVGKGYLNRPDLTAERFPFLERHGERLYRTGDLVRILSDESFDFLGRADDQVKLRGQRLEIGEINSVIRDALPSLKDIATLVLKHPTQQREQLVTFLVTTASRNPSTKPEVLYDQESSGIVAGTLDACSRKLPPYMVPTHAILLTKIPLSANNKTDAHTLKQIYGEISGENLLQLSAGADSSNVSLTEREKAVIRVLGNFASIDSDDVRKSTSIFELGLDSISVFGFSQALKSNGFRAATVSLIMNNSTISQLASALDSVSPEKRTGKGAVLSAKQAIAIARHKYKNVVSRLLDVSASEVESIAPCTALQQGIISKSIESDQPLYFTAFRFELHPNIDLAALRGAWEKAVVSLQILRTRFVPTTEGYVQVALREVDQLWSELGLPDGHDSLEYLAERHRQWWQQNKETFRHPVEIVVARSSTKAIMALHIFHGLYDANSLALLLHLVVAEYKQQEQIDYGPAFHEALAHGPLQTVAGAKTFWLERLQGAQGYYLPTISTDPDNAVHSMSLSLSSGTKFEKLKRRLGVTDQALVQACWLAALRNQKQGDLTIGMVVSGRSIDFKDADRVVGPMFNTIPFCFAFEGSDTWTSVIRKCHDFNAAALPYQHTPLRDIRKWLKVPHGHALFDTLFVFQKQTEEDNYADLWKPLESEQAADYPLAVDVEYCRNGTLQVQLVAQNQYFSGEDLERMKELLEMAYSAMLESSDGLVSHVIGEIEVLHTANDVEKLNGTREYGQRNDNSQDWTPVQVAVRDEISILAGIDAETIASHQSILELGLDSIDAVKLSSRLAKIGRKIPVSTIMRELTIEKIANRLEGKPDEPGSASPQVDMESIESELIRSLKGSKIAIEDFDYVLPTSPMQDAMVAEMLSSDFTEYYNMDVMKLAQDTDVRRLRDAWNTLYQTYPILRTIFIPVDDPAHSNAFAQCVRRSSELALTETSCDTVEDILQLQEQIRANAAEQNGKDTLFSVTLVRCKDDIYLVLSIAHALYDGWSLSLLHSDVQKAYLQSDVGRPHFLETLKNIISDSNSGEAHQFWNDTLAGAQSSLFPVTSTGADEPRLQRLENKSRISAPKLRLFSKDHGVTAQAVALTCWSLVLSSYLRKLDVVFGVVLSGRDTPEANEVMFPTMSTIAFRSFIHGRFVEMLQFVQESVTSAREHQHFPLAKALKFADTNGGPLFDTLFIYQTRPEGEDAGQPLYESIGGASDVEFPVCVEMEIVGDEVIWRTACKRDVLDVNGVEALLERLDSVLQRMLDSTDTPVLDDLEDGLSVAGLPEFEIEAVDPSSTEPSDLKTSEGTVDPTHWSVAEVAVRKVLATVSGVAEAEISKQSTLYHLGLDSISAIKVSRLLRSEGMKLSVSELLRAGSIAKMAQLASSKNGIDSSQDTQLSSRSLLDLPDAELNSLLDVAGIAKADVEKLLPATSGQVYMLSVWQQAKGALFYPEFQYSAPMQLSVDTLQTAWADLVKFNPMLRTVLVATGRRDTPVIQVILKSAVNEVQVLDTDQSEIKKSANQPLVALAVQPQEGDWLIRLKIHHALYDGVSLPLLISQLQDLCNHKHVVSPPLGVYEKYIAQTIPQDAHGTSREFWTSYLRGAPATCFSQPNSIDKRVEIFVPGAFSGVQRLDNLARKKGLPVQALFLAAYARIYARLVSPQEENALEDVVFGIYLANRSHALDDLADLPMPTVNLVPLRVVAPASRSLIEVAIQVQQDLQEVSSVANSAAGLCEIEEWTGVKIDSFVNFLKLPDAGDGGTDRPVEESGEVAVQITELNSRRSEGYGRVVDVSSEEFENPPELKRNVVKGAYLVSRCTFFSLFHAVLT
ncbi:hypothetical protein NA57DRAFT_40954 [Rhizodiscina lignyota]|uniref:Carrier domain-containing protein n=1 Tax=Rhizodiscina lignyota TaxID=1504668 RepID=A0A9P4M3Y4_9PEZI|nr:hypothetical protein NA57DRAFT_40954 [Rhizodiscina lignyota]